MKSLKKLGVFASGILVLSLAACSGTVPNYMRDKDHHVYDDVLGNYSKLYAAAAAETDDSERFVLYAKAEAALLESATFMPTTTQGGNYAVTRLAPRTVPYSFWGNDSDRLSGTVVVKKADGKTFIKSSDRDDLLDAWKEAKKEAKYEDYDPKAMLEKAGYEIDDKYVTNYQTFPETLDILNTSMAADTESLINAVEGLLEYDNFGNPQPKVAKSWKVEAKEGTRKDEEGNEEKYKYDVWTFYLNEGRKWYKADGTVYGEVTAQDFVDGFHHMLDAQAGLEWLAEGIVEGVDDYLAGDIKDFDKVGVTAVDDYTLVFTLEKVESFFPTRLSYSCFMPLNAKFFESKGGAFGIEEFKKASTAATYKFGLVDPESNVYNGPYLPETLTEGEVVEYVANKNYPDYANISTKTLTWIYDAGENPIAYYDSAVAGDISGVGLGSASGVLAKAQDEGIFDDYNYITDTNATTFFGGFNVNRGTFETGSVKSTQSESEKEFTHRAMNNANFRKAIKAAWDREKWNAVSVGDDLGAKNLRNSYTQPEFVSLYKDVVYGEGEGAHTFKEGTSYGDLIEYFLEEDFGLTVDLSDGQDGWYDVDAAKEYLNAFIEEIGDNVEFPIKVDITYFSGATTNTAQAKAVEQIIEENLGKEYVDICLNAATTSEDYYAAGYRAPNGEAGNFDIFYGSGWGPDYGDPSTYLETFLGDGAGYMTKVLGLF